MTDLSKISAGSGAKVGAQSWQIGTLTFKFDLVKWLAVSSLKVRLSRTYLTVLTIATSTAFLMYVLTIPASDDPAERQGRALMLGLSLIVSVAGVINTMLMSVTQRYREIGTMKCLGALDTLILYSVLFESALVGLVGAVLGSVVGLVISILLGLAEFGFSVFSELAFDYIGLKFLVVFLVGMFLTTFGAFVPALIASRLPPIEAMRGEK